MSAPAGWYPDPLGTGPPRWWDGQRWTVQAAPAPVRPVLPPYQVGPVRYRPPLSAGWVQLSVAVRVGVGLSGVLALNDAVSSVWELLTARQVTVGDNLGIAPLLTELLGSVGSLLSLVTGILWLIWQYQLANSAAVDRRQVRRSPEWHVASWVVPIVALWFPLQDIRDLWRAVTDPS